MFAMTDPFFALMMLRNLGPEYIVWDKAGSIAYEARPWRRVRALPASCVRVARARKATAHGARYEPTFHVRIVDREGETVAEVEKTLVHPAPPRPPARAGSARRHARRRRAGRGRGTRDRGRNPAPAALR